MKNLDSPILTELQTQNNILQHMLTCLMTLVGDRQLAGTAAPGPEPIEPRPGDPFVVTDEEIDSGYWLSRKEAWGRLGVVKSTLEEMIRSGELPSYHKKGDEHKKKPRVLLRRADVERMFKTYTLRKGKEK